MQNLLESYMDSVVGRLLEDGAQVKYDALISSDDRSIITFPLDISGTGEDDLIKFANSFFEDHYPSDFSQVSPSSVQMVEKDKVIKQYPNMSASVGYAIHKYQSVPALTVRLLEISYYTRETGDRFSTSNLAELDRYIERQAKLGSRLEVNVSEDDI